MPWLPLEGLTFWADLWNIRNGYARSGGSVHMNLCINIGYSLCTFKLSGTQMVI